MAKIAASVAPEKPPRKRMLLGAGVFIGGQLAMLGAPVIHAMDVPDPWAGVLTIVVLFVIPDLALIAAIAIWGKPGYLYLKGRLFAFLKRGLPPERVGPTRYAVGLTMFLAPIVLAWITPYLGAATGEALTRTPPAIAGDVVFLASFFVLGGEFWDKVRSLFVRRAVAEFPLPAEAA